MAIIYTATSTRPEGVKWFGEANRSHLDEINEWIMDLPGVLGYKPTPGSNENEYKNIIIFENQEACDRYMTNRDVHERFLARDQYNQDNNIVTVKTFKEI
jgi:hypothetical protein